MYKLALASLTFLATSMAYAGTGSSPASSSRSDAGSPALDVRAAFAGQQQAIESDLADGKTYAEISEGDRLAVKGALNRISAALGGVESVEHLSEQKKADVFNDQELINSILTQAGADSRLVCTREKKVGSHRTSTQCYTVAERRRMREQSEAEMRKNFRSPIMESR
jgi:hypothetical protein